MIRVSLHELKDAFQTIRDNILVLDRCAQLANGVGHHASAELEHEIRVLGTLRQEYVERVLREPTPSYDHVLRDVPVEISAPVLSLEMKRKLLSQEPFCEERYTPCRVMWMKVIIRAAYDYALWKESPDLRLRKYAEDARKWFFEPSELFNSFDNICFLFRLPRNELLGWARDLTREQVKKFEFLERNGKDPLTLALEPQSHDGDRC